MARPRGTPDRRPPRPPRELRAGWLIGLGLVAVTAAVFADTAHFPFVDFDDLAYIAENRHVTPGLTLEGLIWAFTGSHEGYWSPLLWLSYMADVGRAGLDAGQFHVTNVVLHAASACLLFWLLATTTRARWPSAFVAAVFAIHPLHVESVAWVTERKDVLSGFFWLLTVAAYVRYTREPTRGRYAVVVAAYACGLMSKPMLVTLPVVLLLFDVWPLGRLGTPRVRAKRTESGPPERPLPALIREKVPLAMLAAAVAMVTIAVQRGAGAVATLEAVPVSLRIGNAPVSVVWYLARMVWPVGLGALYPFPPAVPTSQVIGSMSILVAVSWWVWRVRSRMPVLMVGWFWYLIMLLPVLGFLQVGPQARADRYTYLSMTGIAIMAAWGLLSLTRTPAARRALAAAAGVALAAAAVAAHGQVQHWQSTEALFRRAIAVTRDNYVACAGLGVALADLGRFEEAVPFYVEALRIQPDFAEAHGNLGHSLVKLGRAVEGLPHLREAVRLKPGIAEFHLDLGTALDTLGLDGAEDAYREAIRLAPEEASGYSGLGIALARRGDTDGAARALSEALRLDSRYVDARYNLGLLLARTGRTQAAMDAFREVIRASPDSADAHATLGRLLASDGRFTEAVEALTTAASLRPGDPFLLDSLGGALLMAGRLAEAVACFEQAVRMRPDAPELRAHLAQALEERRRRGGT